MTYIVRTLERFQYMILDIKRQREANSEIFFTLPEQNPCLWKAGC